MKKIALSLILLLAAAACQKTQTETTTASTEVGVKEASAILKIIAGEGVVRGVSLGDSATKVSKNEILDKIVDQNEANTLGFTQDTDALETVDIFYKKDITADTINAISVDVYPNNKADATKYLAELTAYFDAKYGKNTNQIWKISATQNLTLRDASQNKMVLINIDVK